VLYIALVSHTDHPICDLIAGTYTGKYSTKSAHRSIHVPRWKTNIVNIILACLSTPNGLSRQITF